MPKGYLAYFSDFLLGANGQPLSGATVSCYPTSSFAAGTLPGGPAPGVPLPAATATTDAAGRYIFPALPPDDYHILASYTPLGGLTVNTWRYHVPIVAAELVRRSVAAPRAAALPRALARLAGGQSLTIFCLGDDATVGYNATGVVSGGWVATLTGLLAATYPTATVARADPNSYAVTNDAPIPGWSTTTVQAAGPQIITVVNAGVRNDTVLRAVRRFSNLSVSWPGADVLIVGFGIGESSVTDTQRYVPATDFAAHLESLVNIVRTLTQAEILLLTPHANGAVATIDDYAMAVRNVAARTRCDLADLRQLWQDKYTAGDPGDGYGAWLSTAGGNHTLPADAGHTAIAGELLRHFRMADAVPFDNGPYGAAKSYELIRVPYNSGQLALLGSGWAVHGGYQGATLNAANGFELMTAHPGDTLTISGRFADLSMLCRRWSDSGQVGVSVDGGAQVVVDLYRGYPASTSDLSDVNGAIAPQDRVHLAHGLSDAPHTVVITLLASKNALASGTVWRIEALELGRWRRHGYEVETSEAQTRLQRGSAAVGLASAASGSMAVSFPVLFTNQVVPPTVVATAQHAAYYCAVTAISNSGFTLTMVRRDGTSVTDSQVCNWLAFG